VADDGARVGQTGFRGRVVLSRAQALGQAEVEQLDSVVGQKNVGRFEIRDEASHIDGARKGGENAEGCLDAFRER